MSTRESKIEEELKIKQLKIENGKYLSFEGFGTGLELSSLLCLNKLAVSNSYSNLKGKGEERTKSDPL